MWKKITDQISFFPAQEDPLSADVARIETADGTILFDVGASDEVWEEIEKLPGKKIVILSHFHGDHTGNIRRISCEKVYAGKHTIKQIDRYDPEWNQKGSKIIEVDQETEVGGGKIIPIPSSHEKGCLAFSFDGYLFAGDAAYMELHHDEKRHNVQKLKSLIDFLKQTECHHVLLSHRKQYVYDKRIVIMMLEAAYSKRKPNDPYIYG